MTPSDAIVWNRGLDTKLKSTGVVDEELFHRFAEGYGYDAASTVGWLEAKLRVLQARLLQGDTLVVYAPADDTLVIILSSEDFAAWIAKYFPSARCTTERPLASASIRESNDGSGRPQPVIRHRWLDR
ncbi:hypothetical protein C9I56_35020 [Paraburkholderia caribensis]|nr:hypothetical protein C9I56_35020 [Paraburkholderia caribensis]